MKYSFLMGYQHFHLICFAPESKIIGIVDRMQSIGSWSILDSGSAVDHHDWHWNRPWSSRTELRFHSISFDTQAARDKMQQVVQRRTDFSYRIENQVSDVGNDLRQVFVWLKWIDTQVFNTLFHFVPFRRNFEMLLFLSFLLYAFFRLCPMLLESMALSVPWWTDGNCIVWCLSSQYWCMLPTGSFSVSCKQSFAVITLICFCRHNLYFLLVVLLCILIFDFLWPMEMHIYDRNEIREQLT